MSETTEGYDGAISDVSDARQSATCMRWQSESHEGYYDVKYTIDQSEICGIMHDSIKDVMPDSLPHIWTLRPTIP